VVIAVIVLVLVVAVAGAVLGLRSASHGGADAVRIETLRDDATASPAAQGAVPAASGPFLTATDPALDQLVRDVLGERLDHYSIVVKELTGGTGVMLDAGRQFYAASLFKLAVMYEAFRQAETGEVPLTTRLNVTQAALNDDLGTLEKVQLQAGDRLSVGRLVELMIVFSDNTASVLLRDTLGRERIDRTMRTLGLRATSVGSDSLPTTAADMAVLAEAIAEGRGVSRSASEQMTEMLSEQSVRGRVPAGVPAGVRVANKTGTWEDIGHDVAIVYAPTGTYLLVVLSDLTVRDDLIAELSRAVYAHYADRGR
jgi:beta-lactamase class A